MSESIETVPMSSVLPQDFSIPEEATTGKHTFSYDYMSLGKLH